MTVHPVDPAACPRCGSRRGLHPKWGVCQPCVTEEGWDHQTLTAEQADAVNEIRGDYYDRMIGNHGEAAARIQAATGMGYREADWYLCRNEPAEARPIPQEASR